MNMWSHQKECAIEVGVVFVCFCQGLGYLLTKTAAALMISLLGMPPLASPQYRLRSPSSSRSSTRFATTRSLLYDFMTMPGLPPSPSPPQLYGTSSSCLQSRRWEGVLYSVQSVFPRPSSLALGTFPEEQDFSLKFAGVLSFAGLAITGTVDFCL